MQTREQLQEQKCCLSQKNIVSKIISPFVYRKQQKNEPGCQAEWVEIVSQHQLTETVTFSTNLHQQKHQVIGKSAEGIG